MAWRGNEPDHHEHKGEGLVNMFRCGIVMTRRKKTRGALLDRNEAVREGKKDERWLGRVLDYVHVGGEKRNLW